MRALKRILCLALALVLCFGLAGTAFAGNFDGYTDADTIGDAYVEAVDVMMGLGVINGMTDKQIGPLSPLTREQAAKIVAFLAVGGAAESFTAEGDPFTDVSADRWSAGYISYCKRAGILIGNGDGTCSPDSALTGYQWAAMLLRVLGYDASGEYSGPEWGVNVAKDAFRIGLFAGDPSAATYDPIQRRQAMLMAFNALQKQPQRYLAESGTYENLATEAGIRTTLGYLNFQLLRVNETGEAGSAVYYWIEDAGKTRVSEIYPAEDAVLSFTTKLTAAAMGSAVEAAGLTVGAELTIFANGDENTHVFAAEEDRLAELAALTGNGRLFQAFTSDGETIDRVVVVEETLARVSSVNGSKGTVTIGGLTYASKEFKRGETVLVIAGSARILSVTRPETVEGMLTASGTGYVKVDGSQYRLHENITPGVDIELDYSRSYRFYLDSYGNVIGQEAIVSSAETLDYLYVKGFEVSGDSARANADFLDGSSSVVDLELFEKNGETWVNISGGIRLADLAASSQSTGFYSYSVDKKGKFILQTPDPESASEVSEITLHKGTVSFGLSGKYAGARTLLTVIAPNGSLTRSMGVANFPSTAKTYTVGKNCTAILCCYTGTSVTQICVLDGDSPFPQQSVFSALYLGVGETSATGTAFRFLMGDGSVRSYTFTNANLSALPADLQAGTSVVSLLADSEKLYSITKLSPLKNGGSTLLTVSSVDLTYFADSTYTAFYYGSSCAVFDLTGDEPVSGASVEPGQIVRVYGTAKNVSAVVIVSAG